MSIDYVEIITHYRCTILFMKKWKYLLILSINMQIVNNHLIYTSNDYCSDYHIRYLVKCKHYHWMSLVGVHLQLKPIHCAIVTIVSISIANNSLKKMIIIDRGLYQLHVRLEFIITNNIQYYFPNLVDSIVIYVRWLLSVEPKLHYSKDCNIC